jgi:hypothetical protein
MIFHPPSSDHTEGHRLVAAPNVLARILVASGDHAARVMCPVCAKCVKFVKSDVLMGRTFDASPRPPYTG